MMSIVLLLLAVQISARELQGKEVVVTKKSTPTPYYRPTYRSKTHYPTPIVIVEPSKHQKVVPSKSKKLAPPPKKIVVVDDAPKRTTAPKPSPVPSPDVPAPPSPPLPDSPTMTTIVEVPISPLQPLSPVPIPSPTIATSPVQSPPTSPEEVPIAPPPEVQVAPSPSVSPSPTCFDIPPDAEYTCSEQASFGRCDAPFLQNFCNRSCGRC